MIASPPDLEMLYEAVSLAEAEQEAAQQHAPVPPAIEWATANASVVNPIEGRMRFRPYAYQRALLEDDSPRRIVLKARQTGLSNAIAIESLHTALHRPDSTTLFVSRNQRLAAQLITYCQHTLNRLERPPALSTETQSELGFANGSRIISLPASPSTGRGFPATAVYLDEFAFCEYDALIYESVMGTISTGGRMTILSTPNGRANMFFRLWSGLEGGAWSRHKIHWSDCPTYDEAWAERTRAGMTRESFAQEYDLDFLTSGQAVFNPDDLARCREGWSASPLGCERFINAWDIGRRVDPTVGLTIGLRGDTWHEVEYERFLGPYPVSQARIEARALAHPGEDIVESNGPGDPVIENLSVRVEPFQTTARSKVQAIQALQLLIQQGRFKFGSEQLARELGLYQWDDKNLVQDSVMAAAIAALRAGRPEPAPVMFY